MQPSTRAGSRAVGGAIAVLIGVSMMVTSATRMFADGVRADATETVGALAPLDLILGLGGLGALFAGIIVLGYAMIARRDRTALTNDRGRSDDGSRGV